MKRLVKVAHEMFKEVYEGTNGKRSVRCILDQNCVRYIVFVDGKKKSVREFSNGQQTQCFANAEKALNS